MQRCLCFQIPLTLAWAITIHKSQGLTLAKVVIDLGEKDFSPCLSIVAISHVKSLEGLAFHTHFPWSHIQRAEETPTAKLLREDNEWRADLSFELDSYGVNLGEYVFTD
jgi:ATP-dependent exoDNAse (exonuclease V) alpha subunit